MTDEQARRALADQVREVVVHGTHQVAVAALAVGSPRLKHTFEAAVTAASAVVLASDLRAPAGPVCTPDWVPFMTVKRERLANVERLLVEGMADAGTSSIAYHRMRDTLAEVRSMLGGE